MVNLYIVIYLSVYCYRQQQVAEEGRREWFGPDGCLQWRNPKNTTILLPLTIFMLLSLWVCTQDTIVPRGLTTTERTLTSTITTKDGILALNSQDISPSCQASHLPIPRPDLPKAEFYKALYYSFNCIVQQIIIPNVGCGTSSGRRKLAAGQRPGCINANLYNYGGTEAEQWRALAHRSFCLLEERLHETAQACGTFQETRGIYVQDSRYVKPIHPPSTILRHHCF